MAGSLGSSAFNLAILVGVLGYYLKSPTRNFVRSRHETIQDELKRVSEQLTVSQQRYEEFTAKLGAIDSEISVLREQIRTDAESARLRILTEAKSLTQTLLADAAASRDALYSGLQFTLRRELGEKVLGRAEQILTERLTGDDKARLRQEFSQQLESGR